MGVTVLFISFALTLFIIFNITKSCRYSWILSTLTYGATIFGLTEVLSSYRQLNYWSILYFWIGVLIVNISIILYLYKHNKLAKRSLYNAKKLRIIRSIKSPIFWVVAITIFINLLTALIAPPNNWDSMTYHMPRVMHWIQNQSVAHYPTNIIRQISFPPGSGYLIMHFQILVGSDHLANFVQWTAYVGCIIVNSSITEIVFGEKYGLIGALTTASIPMAIMQSTTTQNDLVVSYWLVCLLYFTLSKNPYTLANIVCIGLAFGLGIITKYTAYIFGTPVIGIWIFRYLLKKDVQNRTKLISLVVLVTVVVTPSVPHFLRNYVLFGNILGNDMGTRNESLTLVATLSNFLRLLPINLPIPGMWNIVSWLHTNILHIEVNNPQTTYGDIEKYLSFFRPLFNLAPHEDHVGSPLHLLGILTGTTGIFTKYFRNKNEYYKKLILLTVFSLLGIFLFCLLLKFQPWNNRFLLTSIILSIPMSVYQLKCYEKQLIYNSVLGLLIVSSIIYALTPIRHPILPIPIDTPESSPSILSLSREEIYFSGAKKEYKELKYPYSKAVELISNSNCKKIGLTIGEDDWEYPIWALLGDTGSYQISHVNVNNISSKLKSPNEIEESCAVISTIPAYQNSNLRLLHTTYYPYVAVYLAGGL